MKEIEKSEQGYLCPYCNQELWNIGDIWVCETCDCDFEIID